MAAENILERLANAERDFNNAPTMPRWSTLRGQGGFLEAFHDARDLARKAIEYATPLLKSVEDSALMPLIVFMEQVARLIDNGQPGPGETFALAIIKLTLEVRPKLLELRIARLEASGLLGRWQEDFPAKRVEALREVEKAAQEASEGIRKKAEDAVAEFEAAKAKANKISVEGAQNQFAEAAKQLKGKAFAWTTLTAVLFAALAIVLLWFLKFPPKLVNAIVQSIDPTVKQVIPPVPIPLLVVASAYYTSMRLAFVGILGIGLAFSLRMTRAYFHMIEHNHHKSRVTNSIEAFVASVRTNEQKDLVLSKLVDSVTQFGESGILDKEGDSSSGLSSVILENVTKNMGKS